MSLGGAAATRRGRPPRLPQRVSRCPGPWGGDAGWCPPGARPPSPSAVAQPASSGVGKGFIQGLGFKGTQASDVWDPSVLKESTADADDRDPSLTPLPPSWASRGASWLSEWSLKLPWTGVQWTQLPGPLGVNAQDPQCSDHPPISGKTLGTLGTLWLRLPPHESAGTNAELLAVCSLPQTPGKRAAGGRGRDSLGEGT